MNIGMLIALLLQSGVCSETRFQRPDGAGLTVVVCPMMTKAPTEDDDEPQGKWQDG